MTANCPHCGNALLVEASPRVAELTPVEETILFLVREMRGDGVRPSLEEIGFYMGFSPKSRSPVFNHVGHLIDKGLLVKGRSFSSLALTAAGEAAVAGLKLRSPGLRPLCEAARELCASPDFPEGKAARALSLICNRPVSETPSED